jgi:hypothetical protein
MHIELLHDDAPSSPAGSLRVAPKGLALAIDASGAPTSAAPGTDIVALILPALPTRETLVTPAPLATHETERLAHSEAALLIVPRASQSSGCVVVNGLPALSATLLEDRSEVSIAGVTLVLRTTSRTGPRNFEEASGATCALCKRPLHAGDRVQACNRCHGDHHEGPRVAPGKGPLCCFSYDATCSRCGEALTEASTLED